MLIDDVLVLHVRLAAVAEVADRHVHVEIAEDAREERERAREVDVDVEKALHRAVQPVDERDRRRDRADGERRVAARDDQPAAGEIDQQRADLREHAHQHAKPPAAVLLAEVQPRDLLVHGLEALILRLLAREELHEQRPRDRERLVDELVHLVVFLLRVGEDAVAPLADALGRQDQQRDDDDARDGELPAHRKEGDKRCDHRREVRDDAAERAGDDRAHAGDVRVHARDDVALLLAREERVRHVLQMVVHLVLHVEDDALTDPGVDIALEHGDHLRRRERDEGENEELDEQRHVLPDEGLVHDLARDDAREQPDHRREQDRDEDEDELQPVGLEIAQNAPDQRAVHLREILFFLLGEKAARSEPAGSGHSSASFRFFLHFIVNFVSRQRKQTRGCDTVTFPSPAFVVK